MLNLFKDSERLPVARMRVCPILWLLGLPGSPHQLWLCCPSLAQEQGPRGRIWRARGSQARLLCVSFLHPALQTRRLLQSGGDSGCSSILSELAYSGLISGS